MIMIIVIITFLYLITVMYMYFFYSDAKRYKWLYKKTSYHVEVFNDWVFMLNEGHTIEERILKRNIRSVCVYGLTLEAYRLIEGLSHSDRIEIEYAIDKAADSLFLNIPVIKPQNIEIAKKTDAVIICINCNNTNVKETLAGKKDWQVITLEELVG